MLCPDDDRTQLLIENVDKLSKWLDKDGKTDPELAYWIPKYIPMQGDKPFSKMGYVNKAKITCREPRPYRLEELH
jgi:hypothetical protein